jgi:hypothetical protein
MQTAILRKLIRETLLLEASIPKWFEDLIMATDMDQIAIDVDPATGRTCLDYFAEDNAKFLRVLERDHGAETSPIKNIGYGFQGTVWQLPDGNVMKIANDYGGGEQTYREYLAKMKSQHSGSPESVGDLRILDVFPLIWRYPKVVGEPYVPEHGQVAVIMDKVIPADKSSALEDALNEILASIMLTLSKACVPYLKPEYHDDAMEFLNSRPSGIEYIRLNAPMPWDLRPDVNLTRYSSLMRDDIDKRAALVRVAQEFLKTIDDELPPEALATIKALPAIVGKEFHVRLNPNWWTRLKNSLAQAAREGRSDIKADNFGIDSKGDIIPFDV